MSVNMDINSKEKILAELMVKILKEPLGPIEKSIEGVNDGVLDTKDAIETINDSLGVSVDATEKLHKMVSQRFADLSNEAFPSVLASVQTHLTKQASKQRDDFVLLLGEHSLKTEAYVSALAERILSLLSDIHDDNQEIKHSLNHLGQKLTSVNQGLNTAFDSINKKIDAASEKAVRDNLLFAEKIKDSVNESILELKTIAMQQKDSDSVMRQELNAQQTKQLELLSKNHRSLRKLSMIVGALCGTVAVAIGFSVWCQFG